MLISARPTRSAVRRQASSLRGCGHPPRESCFADGCTKQATSHFGIRRRREAVGCGPRGTLWHPAAGSPSPGTEQWSRGRWKTSPRAPCHPKAVQGHTDIASGSQPYPKPCQNYQCRLAAACTGHLPGHHLGRAGGFQRRSSKAAMLCCKPPQLQRVGLVRPSSTRKLIPILRR